MSENIDLVLEFLRKNRFAKAEAALRGELTGRGDSNGTATQRRGAEAKEDEEHEDSVGSNRGLRVLRLRGARTHRGSSS